MQDHSNSQIIKIGQSSWYVETQTGFDGPFDSQGEAITFQDLIKRSNAARVEFAGLQFSFAD